jgi:hypothetical protein
VILPRQSSFSRYISEEDYQRISEELKRATFAEDRSEALHTLIDKELIV